MTKHMSPKQIAAMIVKNCKALDAGILSWEQFSRVNYATWDLVTRGEQNIIGSACSRRMQEVSKAATAELSGPEAA